MVNEEAGSRNLREGGGGEAGRTIEESGGGRTGLWATCGGEKFSRPSASPSPGQFSPIASLFLLLTTIPALE